MSQNNLQNGFNGQPNGMMYNQNMFPGNPNNTFVTNGTSNWNNQLPNNMIMATPVTQNNQAQIQNQPQNNNSQNYTQTWLPGRLANSPDEIAIVEVPMNCDMAVFPRPDRKEIYVKYWTEQGVQTETFVRKEPEQPAINASESDILNAINNIMERLSKLEASLTGKTTNKKTTNKEDAS